MSQRTRTYLKSKFESGDLPEEADFTDLIDTLHSKEEDTLDNVAEGTTYKRVTPTEKTTWNAKADGSHAHVIGDVTGLQASLDAKAGDISEYQQGDTTRYYANAASLNIFVNNSTYMVMDSDITLTITNDDLSTRNPSDIIAVFNNSSGSTYTITLSFKRIDIDAGFTTTAAGDVDVEDGNTFIIWGKYVKLPDDTEAVIGHFYTRENS